MKKIIVISTLIFTLYSCSNNEDNYVTIRGRVEREVNGEGVANQTVVLHVKQAHGSGQYGTYYTLIESKQVKTDSNGNFSVSVKSADRMFVEAFKEMDENYSTFELKSFNPGDNIVLKVNKFIKFKIYVNNVTPFDSNDYVFTYFYSGNVQNFRTKIENFGVHNNFTIATPGDPSIQDTSWNGTNVNSIIYFIVPESALEYKVGWIKRKNGIESNGSTNDLPFQAAQENEYYFNY